MGARFGHAIEDLGLLASAADRPPRQSAFGEDAYKTI
jgi:hypothetical protein